MDFDTLPIFYEPVTAARLHAPSDLTAPLLVLFDPLAATRAATAHALASSGWLVLTVDTTDFENIDTATRLLSLATDQTDQHWLTPLAFILAEHPTPPTSLTKVISPIRLVHWLELLGFTPEIIPYLLYTTLPTGTSGTTPDHAVPHYLPYPMPVVSFELISTGVNTGHELLPHLAELTGVAFCADCKIRILPQEKALLSTPYLYCARCAADIATVPRQALFPARLLIRAARVFTTNPAPMTNLALVYPAPWEMSNVTGYQDGK